MGIGKGEYKVPLMTSLLRYNVSAGIATATDFSTLLVCKELIGLNPVLGTFIGAIAGATVAFFLGRNWTFFNKDGRMSSQGVKFILVVIGSILLNTFGEYLLTEIVYVGHYMVARVLTAITVGVTYNFPMQRYFVFR